MNLFTAVWKRMAGDTPKKEGSASMFGNSPPLIVTQACERKQPVQRLSKLLD